MNGERWLAGLAFGLLVSAGTAVEARQVVPPPIPVGPDMPRDRALPPRTGTGIVKGRVVDGTTGAPIARARVRLSINGPRPFVYTNAAGAFAVTGLPAGSFTIQSEKSTYLPGRYPEAGRTVRSFTMPQVLRDGQAIEDLTVRMYRGGAISGRVLDAHGDPLEYAQVRVLRVPPGGRGKPQMRNSVQTNDLGEFRAARLEQGSYLLSVMPQRMGEANPSDPLPPQPVATYYPNAPSIDQAQAIVLDRGATVSGIEVVLGEGEPVFVSGTVMGPDGQPVPNGGSVSVRGASRDVSGFTESLGGTGLRQDGTFRIQLPPGDYIFDAQAQPSPQVAKTGTVRAETPLIGSARVSVGAGSIDGVTITLGRGGVATGRMVFDGTSPPPPNNGELRFPIFQADGMSCRAGQPQIAADWTFRVEGLNGPCYAALTSPGGRWTMKSFTVDGEDLLKTPHAFEPGETLRNVQIVFSDRRTEITVRVADDTGVTTLDYVALIFPVLEKGNWSSASQQVRVLAPRPPEVTALLMSIEGRSPPPRNPSMTAGPPQERISGLRPAEYYAIAVDDLDNESTRDPFILERLAESATRITLGDGATIELPLKRLKFADAIR